MVSWVVSWNRRPGSFCVEFAGSPASSHHGQPSVACSVCVSVDGLGLALLETCELSTESTAWTTISSSFAALSAGEAVMDVLHALAYCMCENTPKHIVEGFCEVIVRK